jgi:hypothetical protein
MNAKRICAMLTVASLALPIVVTAAPLPAPTGLSVTPVDDSLYFDWDDVVGAVKYSLDIEGIVTYYDEILLTNVTVEVGVSFGTSDRTDGGDMGDSDLTLATDDIVAAFAAELGVDVGDLVSIEDATAKVKALSPGNGQGRQDNPFSDPPVDVPPLL